jgi:hypothetical protein
MIKVMFCWVTLILVRFSRVYKDGGGSELVMRPDVRPRVPR